MKPPPHFSATPSRLFASRRDFLRRTGSGFGLWALASLLDKAGLLTAAESAAGHLNANPLMPHASHFSAQARSVIWLFMNGGQSQRDTWGYQTEVGKRD